MLRTPFAHPRIITAATTRQSSLLSLKTHPTLRHTQFITLEQPHRSLCSIITEPRLSPILGADACLTTRPGLTLAIKHADCLPILIFHPQGVIAAVHAGRRGTQQQILKKTLKLMKYHFGLSTPPMIWFGPAICKNCHHLNPEKTAFFDLLEENNAQAEAVYGEGIEVLYSDHCTVCSGNTYHSYRRDGAGVPMNWTTITLKS